ncbi:putative E3 ubiquitin-protein ligase SINAT1 [Impatiens glandulifera]|uniref:putative E3 ubiquitin-protein ligase SINAT1 n=1 Tax=Impatiens glandulifera TaxID=253017 RepID=UPI001FB06C8F|nr:putative E3 ubiquitin-protein ligase SINAT1 [Impatiens glandulifera]
MAPGSSSSSSPANFYQEMLESRGIDLEMFAQFGLRTPPPLRRTDPSSSTSPPLVNPKPLLELNKTVSDVSELLECPVCVNVLYPPIYQCPNGHTICLQCKTLVRNQCPFCRFELGDIRCAALEKLAEMLELPCKNQFMGCEEVFSYEERLKHEESCKFKPFDCPCDFDCNVKGDVKFLITHIKNDHRVEFKNSPIINHRFANATPHQIQNATWKLTILSCFGHQFVLHFEAFYIGTAPVYMAFLRFMGEEEDAKKFGYTLEIGMRGRSLTWQGVPRSIRESHWMVRDSLDGLLIHRNMGTFFSLGDGRELQLIVTGRIWKE